MPSVLKSSSILTAFFFGLRKFLPGFSAGGELRLEMSEGNYALRTLAWRSSDVKVVMRRMQDVYKLRCLGGGGVDYCQKLKLSLGICKGEQT
ncbi:hypothetical protein Leryth_026494 [Lithospermum erythrorhizon]|nr:hypothetical protein Leryth_026494 [Lithospermum erythrorhizon]